MRKSQIMYIEDKGGQLVGWGRIGRVTFSKTGKTLHYQGKQFQSLKGMGYKANYFDVETGEWYWISGCKKDGGDALYSDIIEIDKDVQEEYWKEIRNLPEMVGELAFRSGGKHNKRTDIKTRQQSKSEIS
ncbi:MAG: 1-deoxy-D-xylulose-5-phosphate synthase [Methyloligellaceae bacterium]